MFEIGYERFFALAERPFSLTPDPKYFFSGHTHGRALESLLFGLRRKDPFLLVTGDLGIGKTTLCRTLLEQTRRRAPAMYLSSPLLSSGDFERALLDAFHVRSVEEIPDAATIIVDEAHTTPGAVVEALRRFSSAATARGKAMPVVFASQPTENGIVTKSMLALEHLISTRVRLLPFRRDDCAAYVGHRLAHAGGNGISFSPRANDVLFALSGGVPRLVNLLCDRALREAAAAGTCRIDPRFVQAAASALELLRGRPKRFRWFTRTGRPAPADHASRVG